VLTGGAGGRALADAFRDLFDIDGFRGVSMAGRTDHWILTELATRHGIAADDATLQRLRDSYLIHLRRKIQEPAPGKGILPGVSRLLETLAARDDVSLALLTGNLEAGARIKLEHFDLWHYFGCGAFGDDTADRNALFGEAMQRGRSTRRILATSRRGRRRRRYPVRHPGRRGWWRQVTRRRHR